MSAIIQVAGKYGDRMYLDSICITHKKNLYCICSHGIGTRCTDNIHGENSRAGGEGRMKMEGKKLVLTVVGKLVKAEAGLEGKQKQSACPGFFYQPKRPNTKK